MSAYMSVSTVELVEYIVERVAELQHELDSRGAAIERVRRLHRQVVDDSWLALGHCEGCWQRSSDDYVPWPCPTIAALDGES